MSLFKIKYNQNVSNFNFRIKNNFKQFKKYLKNVLRHLG